MSVKLLKKVAIGAAVIGIAVATGGISIAPTIGATTFSAAVAGGLSTTFLGGIALSFGASQILGGLGGALQKTPKASAAQLSALTLSPNPSEPRKWAFGEGILSADLRYIEPSGTDQEYIDYIVACAAHRIDAYREIWFEDEQVWTATGGVVSKYQGYLWIDPRTEGRADNTIAINGGAKWGASRRLTGCAYLRIRVRRTGVSKKAESPLVNGLPSRITIVGRKAPVYDPRYDSTAGGSGPQRANDTSTWAFASDGRTQGTNPALQILSYLLGYRIGGKLSVGRGIPPARIDIASFITAANLCEEAVRKADGSFVRRYLSHGIAGEGDDANTVLGAVLASCNGRLRDSGGRIALAIMHNDLGGAAADAGLNDDDVLSGFTWNPDPSLEQGFNVVRGRYTDPSTNSLYQMVDYPEVSLPSPDGIERVLTLDLPCVQDAAQAQRIAKQVLQRKQYDRSFSATFGANAWRYDVGDIVPFSFAALGFTRRLFRIEQQTINLTGTCDMVLTEENAVIYSWDSEETAAVQVAEPIRYDAGNNPLILAIDQASTTALWTQIVDDGGKPDPYADVTAENIARDTRNVGGRPVGDILETIDLAGITATAVDEAMERIDLASKQIGAIEEVNLGSEAIDRRRDRDLAQMGATIGRLLIEASRSREVMRDAGITVDPATGVVRLFALEEARDHLNDVEVRLSAQDAAITLRATRTYVDEQLALAVIDPTQIDGLEQLIARLSQAEIDIDGANAQIALRASSTDLTTLGLRVSDVEQAFVALGDVVGVTTTVRQARYAADTAGRNALAALLSGDIGTRAQLVALAEIQQQLTTAITAQGDVEVRARLALAAQTAGNAAAILQEAIARTTAIGAEARSRELLQAAIYDPATGIAAVDARVTTERETRVTNEQSQGRFNTAIVARFDNSGGTGKSIEAVILEGQEATAAADRASARRDQDIVGRLDNIGGPGRSAEAAYTQTQELIAQNDEARVRDDTALRARLNNAGGTGVTVEAGIAATREAVAAETEARARAISGVSTRLDNSGGSGRSIEAQVSQLFEATSSLDGKARARMQLVAQAGGGIAGLRAIVEDNNGNITSDLALIARAIGLWLQGDDGLLHQAMGLAIVDGVTTTRFFGKVTADELSSNAALVPFFKTTSPQLAGNGRANYTSVWTKTLTLARPGLIRVWGNIAQSFNQSVPWGWILRIDGHDVTSEGGGVLQDSAPIIGARLCDAGPCLIELFWAAAPGATLKSVTLTGDGLNNTEMT